MSRDTQAISARIRLTGRAMVESPAQISAPAAIELRHLRYFLAVVEELHFGHAAEQLHVSQPPVSRAIQQLENELDLQLLERTRGGVTVTEAGDAFAEQARHVLALFDLAVAEARRAGGGTSTLRVGSLDMLPIEPVQRFLNALREREPALEVTITHVPSREQIRRLRERELDLGILPYAEDYRGIETHSLFAGEAIEALIPRDHPLAETRVLTPDDLSDQVLISGPRAANPALYDLFMDLIGDAGYSFRSVQQSDATNPRDLVLSVAAGDGVMLRPLSFRAVDEAGINVIRAALDPEPTMPETVIAWRSDPPHRLGRVLSIAREVAAELNGGE
jgi:DNA-binding transcriptional LysR family regulator